jgi:hypothetical protein
MPATRTVLADITPVPSAGPSRRRSGALVIESTYIRSSDPDNHALEAAAQAWSRYNRHLFRQRRDDRSKPYPEVDSVYVRSDTWKASDDTFKDLFLDDMCVFLLLNYFFVVTHHHE